MITGTGRIRNTEAGVFWRHAPCNHPNFTSNALSGGLVQSSLKLVPIFCCNRITPILAEPALSYTDARWRLAAFIFVLTD